LGSCNLRLGLAFGLMGCMANGVCQPAPEPSFYESFFRQVAALQNVSGPIALNGQPSGLTRPTPQDAIGLTDQESQALNALASDFEDGIRSLDSAFAPLVFEGRLRRIESDETSVWLAEKLKDLEDQRNHMVSRYMQRLRAAFGDSRFEALDAFVRSRKLTDSFFPLVPQVRPVRAKK
jgi:hypothetical protein